MERFIPRLGGMHWVMSSIGCIGKSISNSGLERIMGSAFGGADKMLLGKKFPMNVRALRFVLLELLIDFKDQMSQYNDLDSFIDSLPTTNRLALGGKFHKASSFNFALHLSRRRRRIRLASLCM